MPRFIVLLQFTGQGIANVAETIQRADAFKRAAKKSGCKVVDQYWTRGTRDGVMIVDGDDDSVTALLLALGRDGNVRTETLRAFGRAEMEAILGRMG